MVTSRSPSLLPPQSSILPHLNGLVCFSVWKLSILMTSAILCVGDVVKCYIKSMTAKTLVYKTPPFPYSPVLLFSDHNALFAFSLEYICYHSLNRSASDLPNLFHIRITWSPLWPFPPRPRTPNLTCREVLMNLAVPTPLLSFVLPLSSSDLYHFTPEPGQ